MNQNRQYVNLIINAAKALGLEAFDHHFSGHGPDMYNIGVYGFREELEMFEFYWYDNEDEINYNLLVDLGDQTISNRLSDEIMSYFSKDRVVGGMTIGKAEGIVAITGSFKKEHISESLLNEILQYFKSPAPAMLKLIALIKKAESDNKSM